MSELRGRAKARIIPARVAAGIVAIGALVGALWLVGIIFETGWDWKRAVGAAVLFLLSFDFGLVGAWAGRWPFSAFAGGW